MRDCTISSLFYYAEYLAALLRGASFAPRNRCCGSILALQKYGNTVSCSGMQTTIKIQARGVLTLPKKIREKAGLSAGSIVDIEAESGKVTMRPVSRLDPDLQEDLRKSLHDFKTGNYIEFSSADEFHRKRKAKWGRKA